MLRFEETERQAANAQEIDPSSSFVRWKRCRAVALVRYRTLLSCLKRY